MGFDRIGSWQTVSKKEITPWTILGESTSAQNNSVKKNNWPDKTPLTGGWKNEKMLVSQGSFSPSFGVKKYLYQRLTSKASETRPQKESPSPKHWFSGGKLLLVSGRPTATLRFNVHVRFIQLVQNVATHRIFIENQTSLTWIIHTKELLLKKSCTTCKV